MTDKTQRLTIVCRFHALSREADAVSAADLETNYTLPVGQLQPMTWSAIHPLRAAVLHTQCKAAIRTKRDAI
jgi:hypothetical protein